MGKNTQIDTPELSLMMNSIRGEIRKVIIGQDNVIEELLICLMCGGHCLLVGVPGLAKTLLISTLARSLNLKLSRIQFTPDLMPSDITGTEIMEEDRTTGGRSLRFVKGPVFANLILADEINRTPPKTQAALLEAMQETQVTASGSKYPLPKPFFVLATQNPIEQEGTYPLPEAQLDRFMFNTIVSYPSQQEELEIVLHTTSINECQVEHVLDAETVLSIQKTVRSVPVAEHVASYAVRLARSTRVGMPGTEALPIVRDYIRWGCGPRASQYLILAAKAKSLLAGDTHVQIEHIKSIAHPVLRHRLLLNFNAEADKVTTDEIITSIIEKLPIDTTDENTKSHMDQVAR